MGRHLHKGPDAARAGPWWRQLRWRQLRWRQLRWRQLRGREQSGRHQWRRQESRPHQCRRLPRRWPTERRRESGLRPPRGCRPSLRMSKDEEAKRLGRAQRRLLHLRLINGGQLNEGKLGPPTASCSRAGTRPARAAPSSGWSTARPPPCAHRPVRRADARRVAPPLPVALLAATPRMGRYDHFRPLVVRPGAGGTGGGSGHRGAVAEGLRGDQRLRAHVGAKRGWSSSSCGCTCRTRSSCGGSCAGATIHSIRGS